MVARPGGAGGYLHWEKYNKRKQPMPIAIVVGAAPGGAVHRRAKARRRSRRDCRVRRARRPAGAGGEVRHRRSRRARRRRDRDRGPDRSGKARARGAVRREQRLCRARSLQHAHAGHRDHAPQEPGVRLHHQPGDAERVEPGQEGRLRAAVSDAPARRAVDPRRPPRGDARAADQPAAGDLRAIRRRHAALGGLARHERRGVAQRHRRQDRHRGERGHRPRQSRRRDVGDRLSLQSGRGRAHPALSRRRAGRRSTQAAGSARSS